VKGHNCNGVLKTKNLNMEQIIETNQVESNPLTPAVIPSSMPEAVNPNPDELGRIADVVRKAFPLCKQAWQDFNQYRFGIGLCLIRARDLLSQRGGNRNPGGNNQHGRSTGHGGQLTSLESSKPAFTAEQAGLISWMEKEFPQNSLRTLRRYREWTERKALPIIEQERQQLQLPMGDVKQIEFFELPEEQRGAIGKLLKQAVDAKDVTQTLRSMEEAPGDPDAWGPQGGARKTLSPRRSKEQITTDEWEEKARAWCKNIKTLAAAGLDGAFKDPAGKKPDVNYWDTMSDEVLDAVKVNLFDLYRGMQSTLARRDAMAPKQAKRVA
jgi:hypothetical protein